MADVDLSLFETEIEVRPLRIEDFDQLITLQKRCFPSMATWARAQIESQLTIFPEGQFVIDRDGRVIASASCLIVDFDEYDDQHSWSTITDGGYIRNHDPEGETLYGMEIMVDPEFRGMKLSRRLYDARKKLAVERNLKRIVIGGRMPGYSKHSEEMSARAYADRVVKREIFDPVLTAQLNNGFVLKRIISRYLADAASENYATLLEWSNVDHQPHRVRRQMTSQLVRICCVQYQMRPIADFDEFARHCEYFTDVSSSYKSDFTIFPEIFTLQLLSYVDARTPGEAVRKLAELTPAYLELFSRLAVKYDTNILGGSHFSVEDGDLYNIAYLFHRNGGIDKQYKLHITPSERKWWGAKPGKRLEVFETDSARVAINICYDVEFPELGRLAAEQGAQLLLVPFCTDDRHGYLRVRYCAQARCIENQIYAAIAGTVGNLPHVPNMDIQYAQSAILTPSDIPFSRDAVGAETTPNVETIIFHDVDLELLRRTRQGGTVTNWLDRRKDLYEVRWAKGAAERVVDAAAESMADAAGDKPGPESV